LTCLHEKAVALEHQSYLRTNHSQERGNDGNHLATTSLTNREREDEALWSKTLHLRKEYYNIFSSS